MTTEQELAAIYQSGRDAFVRGEPETAADSIYYSNTAQYRAWRQGWEDAKREADGG